MFEEELKKTNGNIHYINRYIRFVNGIIERGVSNELYTERHHILPKSLFPQYKDDPDNILVLSGREHFIAHWLLAKAYGGSMWYALNQMMICNEGERRYTNIPSKIYHKTKEEFALIMSEKMKGRGNYWFGKDRAGDKNPMFGQHHSEQTKQKISERAKERLTNPDNRPFGDRNGMYGRTHSKETIERMIESRAEFIKNIDPDHIWKKKTLEVINKIKKTRSGKVMGLGEDGRDHWINQDEAYYRNGRYYCYSDASIDDDVYKKYINETYSNRKCYTNSEETKKRKSAARTGTKRVSKKDGSFRYVKSDQLDSFYKHEDGKYYDYPP